MAGVLDHFQDNVQVWDGLSFSYMPRQDAAKLVKQGTHQISTGICASELKTAAEFNEARERKKPKTKTRAVKAEAGLPGVDEKQTYKTREMKAET